MPQRLSSRPRWLTNGLLGVAAMYINVPDFPAADPLTALAVGIVSGLAATGADQVIKQIGNDN